MMKLLFAACLIALVAGATVPDKATYDCGSECEEPLMGSRDPKADQMPHDFGPHIPTSPKALLAMMNAYDTNAIDHSNNHNLQVAMPGATSTEDKVLREWNKIPYEPQPDQPALRRPCNLDEVLALIKSVKADYELEDKHDRTIESSLSEGNSALVSAKASVDQARRQVKDLEHAKEANATLRVVLENIALKAGLLQEHTEEKSLLIKEEGMMKTPIVKTVGRTNVNLQNAIAAKQQALNDFAQHPAFTKEEINEILATYDELIINIKQQIAASNKEASDVLTPVQLQLNQTQHTIERVKAEINELKRKQLELEPVAEKYTPEALAGAKLVLDSAMTHHSAETLGSQLDTKNRDQRTKDRAEILSVLDELVSIVSGIQEPQDPKTVGVVADQEVVSLAGSVPKLPPAL